MEIIVLKQVAMVISIVMASSNSVYAPEVEAHDNPEDWILEEVAGIGEPAIPWSPSYNVRTSIAIDSNDLPHIAFRNVETREISYSHKDSTGKWHTETVVSADIGGTGVALALDLEDRPVICYRNMTTPAMPWLSCAFSEGSGWRHVTVDPAPWTGYMISLTIDYQNRSHVAYCVPGGDTKYAWWNGASWNISVLRDRVVGTTDGLSMDLDSLNRPHVALLSMMPGSNERGLWLYRLNGTKWDKEVIDPSHSRQIYTIDLNETDTPYVATVNPSRKVPILMYKDGVSWRTRYVDLGARAGFGSFLFDSDGGPHLAYTDRNHYDLRYAHTENGTWMNETVDSEGLVGLLPSVATDNNNNPHISYLDLTDRRLMYATKKKQIKAVIDIDPDTLNPLSRGKWITCYIELPPEYDPKDINASTILLMDALSPELNPKYGFVRSEESYIVDHDGNGIYERMVKFDRQKVIALLDPGDAVTLTVTGQLNDGTGFQGSDTIRVVHGPTAHVDNFTDRFTPQRQADSSGMSGCRFFVSAFRTSAD